MKNENVLKINKDTNEPENGQIISMVETEEEKKIIRHLSRSNCSHYNKLLGENPTSAEVIKYTIQQRILALLQEKFPAEEWSTKISPFLKEKIGLGKKRAYYLTHAWIEKFTVGYLLNYAEDLGINYELSFKISK